MFGRIKLLNKLIAVAVLCIVAATASPGGSHLDTNNSRRGASESDEHQLKSDNVNCSDSPLKFKHPKRRKRWVRCKWALNRPSPRCEMYGVASHCPFSCNTCNNLVDSKLKFKIRLDAGTLVRIRCEHLREDASYCSIADVAATCPITCRDAMQTPTVSPLTLAPTTSPVTIPRSVPTGKICSQNSDCISGVCDTSTKICYATDLCKAIKHNPSTEFDQNHLILLFVGSGFTDLNDWQRKIKEVYYTFDSFQFFKSSVDQFSAFYVNSLASSFCNYNCHGIQRLLCCDVATTRTIGRWCFPHGVNVQTIVVHNDNQYGGAGYMSQNIATTSTHSSASLVAVHELGHSLFKFTDEYSSISSTPSSSINCESHRTCGKWNDLIDSYPTICSSRGCAGNNYYVSEPNSFMKTLNYNVGPVLTRYTCCTYYSMTGSVPSYCNIFFYKGTPLYIYCTSNGYAPDPSALQNRQSNSILEGNRLGKTQISVPGSTLLYLSNPIKVVISLSNVEESQSISYGKYFVQPGYFPSETIDGENDETIAASSEDMIKVTLTFDTKKVKELYVLLFDMIAVPPMEKGGVEYVKVKKDKIEVIVDSLYGTVIGVNMSRVLL